MIGETDKHLRLLKKLTLPVTWTNVSLLTVIAPISNQVDRMLDNLVGFTVGGEVVETIVGAPVGLSLIHISEPTRPY